MTTTGEPRLVASVIVRDELDRYLLPFLEHLTGFCDEVRVLDDGSTDGWEQAVYHHAFDLDLAARSDGARSLDHTCIKVLRIEESRFWQDEGAARQMLLDWTLQADPDWVLAIDADEFVSDPQAIRAACETGASILTLNMQEVWKLSDDCVCVRQDGGWREHPIPILWRVPGPTVLAQDQRRTFDQQQWRIPNRKVAPGREPQAIRDLARSGRHTRPSGSDVLHFGWTCEADRAARHARYVEHDGGRYHASAHLRSIMFPDARVRLDGRDWPAALDGVRDDIAARALRA